MNLNNKIYYYSKNISPISARNSGLKSFFIGNESHNSNSQSYNKKSSKKEKYSFGTYNMNNKNGNMFAIHKILENNLFSNKMKEKTKKNNNINKKIYLLNNINEGICLGINMNHSYSINNKKFKNNNNIFNNSSNLPSDFIIFSPNQKNSD